MPNQQPNTYSGQWQIDNLAGPDLNIRDIWEFYSGDGVNVAVVDDGVELDHSELINNIGLYGYDAADGDDDPSPELFDDDHGTAVSSLIVSANDGVGVTGIAFGADLSAFRIAYDLNNFFSTIADSFARHDEIDVSNNSWGYLSYLDHPDYDPATNLAYQNFVSTVEDGRNGLGTVFVFAAGNDGDVGQDVNLNFFNSSRYGIAVGASSQNGELAEWSTTGAAVLVTAPGESVATADRTGVAGYDFGDYGVNSGTSFSSPIVSGIVALMLEANPNLGYRDVQEILAYSSRNTDSSDTTWEYNGATNWNGGGLHTSDLQGFGFIDASAAVKLAETWHKQSTAANEYSRSYTKAQYEEIPDGTGSVESVINASSDVDISHVEINVNTNHDRIGNLVIKLISPNGTESILMNGPDFREASGDYLSNIEYGDVEDYDFDPNFTLTSNEFWGENSEGEWKLVVEDQDNFSTPYEDFLHGTGLNTGTGDFFGWTISFHGDRATPFNQTYIYTDEYSDFEGDSSRTTLNDVFAKAINAATVSGDTTILLDDNASEDNIGGTEINIVYKGAIEDIYTGDGNDNVSGNSRDNTLKGGAGNDSINGNSGNDLIEGGLGDDVMNGGQGVDTISYSLSYEGVTFSLNETAQQDTIGAGLDQATGFENIIGSRHDDNLTGNALGNVLNGQSGDDILTGGLGNDRLIGGDGSDTASYIDINNGVVVNLALLNRFQLINGAGSDLLIGIENLSGSDFNDRLYGNAASNVLTGNAGNDLLNGKQGADQFYGGLGNDIYYLDNAGDEVFENDGEGFDKVFSSASVDLTDSFVEQVILIGRGVVNAIANSLNNFVRGNANRNILEGGDGNDTIDGHFGFDIASYESAALGVTVNLSQRVQDTIGAGEDTLIRIEGLRGSEHDDTLIGNRGNNIIEGGAGNDILNGLQGIDTISFETADTGVTVDLSKTSSQDTGEGLDQIIGFENIKGSLNDDTLIGNNGHNTLFGSSGDDILIGGLGNDRLFGDAGNDTVSYQSANRGVVINLNQTVFRQNTRGAGFDLIKGVENVEGSNFNDTLIGNVANNTLYGLDGNDVLNGHRGADEMYGGLGNDTYIVDNINDLVYESVDSGYDTVRSLVSITLESGQEIEKVLLLGRAKTNATGNEFNNTINGNVADNIINGGDGDDLLIGGLGNDDIDGGDGIDTVSYQYVHNFFRVGVFVSFFDSVIGNDMHYSFVTRTRDNDDLFNIENIIGSKYNDTITGNKEDNVLNGWKGNDKLDGLDGEDTASYKLASGNVIVNLNTGTSAGADGRDTLINIENIEGSNFSDTLTGNTEANDIYGLNGHDQIIGLQGTDSLFGGRGNDTLTGDLIGGDGTDSVDIFVFDANSGSDIITDFASSVDKIDLSGWDATEFNDLTIQSSVDGVTIEVEGYDNIITVSNISDTSELLSTDFIFA